MVLFKTVIYRSIEEKVIDMSRNPKTHYCWNHIDFELKVLRILKNSKFKIFRKFQFWPIVRGISSKSINLKNFLVRLYHHAKFQRNRSTTMIFMSILRFFLILYEIWDESGAAEMRDRHMVSLAKMMLMGSSVQKTNVPEQLKLPCLKI